jgi:hypothetical protein
MARWFFWELRKIWNLRIFAAVAVIAALFALAFLLSAISGYNSLTVHGSFGEYQSAMYAKYGATLEPEELVDFDIEGKKAAVIAEADAIIAQHEVFAENGISNYDEYCVFSETDRDELFDGMPPTVRDEYAEADAQMQLAFMAGDNSLDAWYRSPVSRLQHLDALERYYVDYENEITTWLNLQVGDETAVTGVLEKIVDTRNAGLVNDYLASSFSMYTAAVGVLAIIVISLLVAPMITTDRARGIVMLQYSSKAGRKLFAVQFAATVLSATVVSTVMCALSFIPWLSTDAARYLGDDLLHFGLWGTFMLDITFGQYVMLLYGLVLAFCVATSAAVFVLARYSNSIISLMLKAVPLVAAVSVLCTCAVNSAFIDSSWLFTEVFNSAVRAPEVWVCAVVTAATLCCAVCVIVRERRIDLV